ncbi:DoxX family membrane protein [Nocardia sp. NPDC056611]|uniref:DoxX family membrane protein n=1 Tax=Nocardia sp. NPDC056611 TaxID=3345877 RepID=UPI00366D92A4
MLRRIAHPLLATAFVADGIDTLTHPDPRIKTASEAVRQGEQRLPAKLAAYLPDDPATLVRINAAVRVGGGALLALGKLPRLSTAVLAATVIPSALTEPGFWTEVDPERRSARRNALLKDVSLLGGLLIASTDRQGKPSLGWRGRRALAKLQADDSATTRLADAAKVHGPELAAAVRTRGEHLAETARERGPELAAALHDRGERLADIAQQRGAQLADSAREHGPELVAALHDRGERLADVVQHRGERLAEAAQQRGAQLTDSARELGAQWSDVAADRGGQLLDTARDQGGHLAARAKRRGERLADAARTAADRAH